MKRTCLLLGLCLLAPPMPVQADVRYENGLNLTIDYLDVADDIPLAPGLTQDSQATLVYDKPDGRIVKEAASGDVDVNDVIEFYKETLPPLGWVRLKDGGDLQVYWRKDEQLTLELEGDQDDAIVRFTIVPKNP